MLSPDPRPYVDKTLHSSKLSVRSSLPTPESPAEPLQLHLPSLTPLQGSHQAEAQTSEQRPESGRSRGWCCRAGRSPRGTSATSGADEGRGPPTRELEPLRSLLRSACKSQVTWGITWKQQSWAGTAIPESNKEDGCGSDPSSAQSERLRTTINY